MAQLQTMKHHLVEPEYGEPEQQFEPALLESRQSANMDYARALQQRLLHAYDPSAKEQKFPVPQRIAIVLALTCALWAGCVISVALTVELLS